MSTTNVVAAMGGVRGTFVLLFIYSFIIMFADCCSLLGSCQRSRLSQEGSASCIGSQEHYSDWLQLLKQPEHRCFGKRR
jgi:hypothetical protein